MLCGFSNLPASFQKYINKILAEQLDVYMIIYLDNILIYINKADYVNSIWYILDQLKKYFLYANIKKCCFH